MTFVFGLIISFVCPVIFCLQNFLLGLFITNGKMSKGTVTHVLKTLVHQLVVVYDLTLFDINNQNQSRKKVWKWAKLGIGYLFYLVPVGIIGYLFLTIRIQFTICTDMKDMLYT